MGEGIDAKESEYLYKSSSQIKGAGFGLFTAIDVFKDEIISVFKGEILSQEEGVRRKNLNEDQYFIEMLDGSIMDSKNTTCFAKFANDASLTKSKSISNNSKISLNDQGQVCLIATKRINSGEEVFCAYGKKYWKRHGSKL